MIIPINVGSLGSTSGTKLPPQLAQFGTDELILIELQGTLDVEGDKEGQLVGRLRVDATKKPTLLIGHHLLEGKLMNLPKPIAVLHRSSPACTTDGMTLDINEDESTSQKVQVGWNMVAIVRRKMVFSRRPMPMVGKVEGLELGSGGTLANAPRKR